MAFKRKQDEGVGEVSERLKTIKYNWEETDWGIDKSDINWLIEQAEQNEQRNKKINKVHEYLQEVNAIDQKIENGGHDDIDVLLRYSKEQEKKTRQLERELEE